MGFSHDEVQQLMDHFKEISKDTSGVVTKAQFLEAIEFVTHAGEAFAERLFRLFDEPGEGQINIGEFQMGLHVMLRGTPEECLAYVFQTYDTNNDGTITRDEMMLFLQTGNKLVPNE